MFMYQVFTSPLIGGWDKCSKACMCTKLLIVAYYLLNPLTPVPAVTGCAKTHILMIHTL